MRKSEKLISSRATDVLPSTHRSYQISLTWLWTTRARVTDSDQTIQRGIRISAVLAFGLRVSRLKHSATRTVLVAQSENHTNEPPMPLVSSICFWKGFVRYKVNCKRRSISQLCRGGSSPKLKGGKFAKWEPKNVVKSKHTEGVQKLLGLFFRDNSLVFQLNNALIHMFPTFRTKHEKRVHLG